jgi:hypothetical protein
MATDRLETILAQARRLSPAELAQLIKQAADRNRNWGQACDLCDSQLLRSW